MKKLLLLVSIGALSACTDGSCPPDYPVMRDGFCYRADGGAMLPIDGGSGGIDSGMSGDDAGRGVDAGDLDAAVICNGAHPMFDDTQRWCDPGCYCSSSDSCFAAEVADACCDVDVVCGPPQDTDAGSGVICTGTHPLLSDTEPRRYCAAGNCYCGDLSMDPPLDACYPMAIADACCPVDVVCY